MSVLGRALPLVMAALHLIAGEAMTQGLTTAGVRGHVTAQNRRTIDARVRVRHDGSGFTVEVYTSKGRFLVQGLEPGGPYTIDVRAVGYAPGRRQGVMLGLGELRAADFALESIATLDTVGIANEAASAGRAPGDGGTGFTISASQLEHLPTLNRDIWDFVRLVPQISTKISLSNPGLSAGGIGFRYNNYLINGVSERTLSGGVSNAFAGVRSIPIGAVQEYQVLIAPYDVRYGDFAGALVNAVTRSGTNALAGSAFLYGRTDNLARRLANDSSPPYERAQYGFTLGGPLVRDRLHFFVAPEVQHFSYPADGPYVGQPAGANRAVPVNTPDLERFESIMRGRGLTAGSAGPVDIGAPLRNLFARLDLALPERNSRLIVWNNYSRSDDLAFSRTAPDVFSLSSYSVTRATRINGTALQLHTLLSRGGGGHNELLVSRRSERIAGIGAVQQPIIRVTLPSVAGGSITLNSGTNEIAQATSIRSASFSVKDNLTVPLATTHVVTFGAEFERFRVRRPGPLTSYGTWDFASLDNLEQGIADRYEVRLNVGYGDPPLAGAQYTAYAGNQWQPTDRMSVTAGVRADLLAFDGHVPYVAAIDSAYSRRTDLMPNRRIEWSPRFGFVWNVSEGGRQLIRGGAGIFTSRYPLAWAHTALTNYGTGSAMLTCDRTGTADRYPPPFDSDFRSPPTACGGGSTVTQQSHDVDLLAHDLRLMRVGRASLAHEHRLPGGLLLTNEALFTRGLSDLVFVNLLLPEPVATDPHGRVMYATLTTGGTVPRPAVSTFSEVIEVRNTSRNRSYQLSTRLEAARTSALKGFASYTWSRTRDVQTPVRVNTRGTTAWATARATGGRHDDMRPGISGNDLPHRVIVAGTYHAPWRRSPLELSFYYVGESGRPFTYLAFGTRGRGDLNADGSNANDPMYIPHNALDTAEVRFSGVSDSVGADASPAAQATRIARQRTAFDSFVRSAECLRRQRGRVMTRNSCREPWSHTTIASLRQSFPIGVRLLEVQLEISNVLNLFDAGWGLRREAAPAVLEHFGQTSGSAATSAPVFRFNPTSSRWTTQPAESSAQLQLSVRYRF